MESEPKQFLETEEGKIEQIIPLKFQVVSLLQKKEVNEATELLVKDIMSTAHIYTTREDKASEMWFYSHQDGIYIPNGEASIKEHIRKIMNDHYSEWLASQVIAKIKTDTYIDSEEFFKERDTCLYEIAVMNGILDLKTLILREFNPQKIFFSKFPVYFDENAECPKIDQFLKDVLKEEDDLNVFYELAGFGLVKEYFMERAFMFIGNGRNGKGKSIELLKRLVGVANTASVPLSALGSNSPFVERLWRRHFNLAGDLSSGSLKDTGMFKQLTGRDPISANRKYKNVIEFTNYAKMVFACNELPRVYDGSDGFWDRWILLEFPYKFVEKHTYDSATEEERKNWKIRDENIIKEITNQSEMSGFLNMAIAGLHRLFNGHRFSYTKGTGEVKESWMRRSDSFMAFCLDMIEEDYESRVTKKEVRKVYKEYCKLHKVSGVSDIAMKRTLQELYGASEEYARINEVGNQEYLWTGIKFK